MAAVIYCMGTSRPCVLSSYCDGTKPAVDIHCYQPNASIDGQPTSVETTYAAHRYAGS